MRTRSPLAATLALALVQGACVHTNPDPREPTIQAMQREGMGGWIVVTTKQGWTIGGELISVERNAVFLLPVGSTLRSVPRRDVASARLYEYVSEGGTGGWGAVGSISTLTHGFFLIFTFPLWVLWTGATARVESTHVILEIPGAGWTEVAKWARFPQGMPAGFGAPGRGPVRQARPPGAPDSSSTPIDR